MRLLDLEPYWPKITNLCGAAAGSAASAIALVGQAAEAIFGVPLPVVIASAAGAFASRAFLPGRGFFAALGLAFLWTILGCAFAPLAQAVIPGALAAANITVALPPGVQSGLAAAAASVPWWGPRVWPLLVARFPWLGVKSDNGSPNA